MSQTIIFVTRQVDYIMDSDRDLPPEANTLKCLDLSHGLHHGCLARHGQ